MPKPTILSYIDAAATSDVTRVMRAIAGSCVAGLRGVAS